LLLFDLFLSVSLFQFKTESHAEGMKKCSACHLLLLSLSACPFVSPFAFFLVYFYFSFIYHMRDAALLTVVFPYHDEQRFTNNQITKYKSPLRRALTYAQLHPSLIMLAL
jgi:hypothetical protein